MNTPFRIAFVCTGNCCRSQMAEAILRHVGGARFQVTSAGSQPAGFIHPLAIDAVAAMGLGMEGQYSKSWDEIAETPLDIIITLCDSAAGLPCPSWIGRPVSVHWSLPDPSFYPGTDEERQIEARRLAESIRKRAELLAALPLETMRGDRLPAELRRLADVW